MNASADREWVAYQRGRREGWDAACRLVLQAMNPMTYTQHVDSGPDEDGHCTVCGLPWHEEWSDEPHECPPGFRRAPREKPKMSEQRTDYDAFDKLMIGGWRSPDEKPPVGELVVVHNGIVRYMDACSATGWARGDSVLGWLPIPPIPPPAPKPPSAEEAVAKAMSKVPPNQPRAAAAIAALRAHDRGSRDRPEKGECMSKGKDWLIAHDVTGVRQPPYTLECLRCGGIYSPALPVSVNVFVAMCRAFEKEHKHCKASKP